MPEKIQFGPRLTKSDMNVAALGEVEKTAG